MATILRYKALDAPNMVLLQELVEVHLADGWELVGGVNHIHMPVRNGEDGLQSPETFHHTHWTQAVTKKETV